MQAMDEKQLESLATQIKNLLIEYRIEVERFNGSIFVSQEYYDRIKGNFQKRNPILDAVVGNQGDDWKIDLIISPLSSSKNTN